MGKNILKNVLLFIVIFLALNFLLKTFTGDKKDTSLDNTPIGISVDAEVPQQKTVSTTIKNNTQENLVIKNQCPKNPLTVNKKEGETWKAIQSEYKLDCSAETDLTIEPGKTAIIMYDKWNHALFGDSGTYKLSLNTTIQGQPKTFESNEFQIVKRSIFRFLWDEVFYNPIYNALILITNLMPFKDLGLGIILLTIIIRLILFFPAQSALKSQKKMQEIQPELDRIKEKHKGDQSTVGQETMRIFKENKVNPFGSCLPILIQFPFLIAIFYAIQNGLNMDNSYIIYPFLKGFVNMDNIHTMFLGILDLTKKNTYVLPLIIGALQFAQMKLSFAKPAKKKEEDTKAVGAVKKPNEMASVNNAMTYFMPVMIAIFTASVPAGVALYWGTSTIFGIGQQIYVNKSSSKKKNDEPTVKVIHH